MYKVFLFLLAMLAGWALPLGSPVLATGITTGAAFNPPPCCGPLTRAGERLGATLDGMHVESLWIAKEHVNWETGEPDKGSGYAGPGTHTHCSAFAAAAAKKVGVYLLHPPEHGQVLLSNAQARWMVSPEARADGWRPIQAMQEAQQLANEGQLVVVLFQSPDQKLPGHVAVVRPSVKTSEALLADGPQIIMAGTQNYTSTTVKHGFDTHPGAWPDGVRYYVHTLP